MQLYASVARYKFQGAKEILLLGADTKGHENSSETIYAIDASIPMTSDERVMSQKIMNTYQILDNVSERRIQTSHSIKDVARNDPCPCGSKKKYKKCCLNSGTL